MKYGAAAAGMLAFALCGALPFRVAAADHAGYVPVPAGMFHSTLSGPPDYADVRVEAFAMRDDVVTNAEYLAFVRTHPEWRRGRAPAAFADANYLRRWAGPLDPGSEAQARQPVTDISWFAAQAYCESEGARLPTWYEWERVAAADATRFDARQDPAWLAAILAWYGRAESALGVTGGAPNAYGVRDMHGLVWEWVDDFNSLLVSADSRNQGDPDKLKFCGAGAISLQDRENYAILMRVALLSSLGAADTTNNLGFRCARSANPLEER
ncbi:MAG TPA: formylglycine-generating enzyme family protein [Burkholderiaceae bacterium]